MSFPTPPRILSHETRCASKTAWIAISVAVALLIWVLVWQGVSSAGNPNPIAPNTSEYAAIFDIGVLVFREGLECILVLAAITAGLTGEREVYRRPVAIGAGIGLLATLITWCIVVRLLDDASKKVSALDLQAATGLLAVIVLLVVMNWFFHKMYWTGWISLHNRRKHILLDDRRQDRARNVTFGMVPDFLHLGDAGRYYVQLGKRVGCFGTKNDGKAKASFYFASERPDYGRRDVASQKRLLREMYADVKWEAQRILEFLDEAPDFYFDSLSQVKMGSWSMGRVVLLGDAAACASPMAGMGTSIAMVGAYVLAGELKEAGDDYAKAFANYEAAMRRFVNEAQKMAEGVSWFIPQTRLKLWFSKKLWSWMPQSTLRKLMIEQPARIANLVELKEYE